MGKKLRNKKRGICYILVLCIVAVMFLSGSDFKSEAKTGKWKKDRKGWYYSYSDGSYAKNQWLKVGGKWYHFDKKGYMQTGWKKIGNKRYFFTSSGAMKTGWLKQGGEWYYLNPSNGAMVTGWKKIGGKYQFFKATGVWKELVSKRATQYANITKFPIYAYALGYSLYDSQYYESRFVYKTGNYPTGTDSIQFNTDGTFSGNFVGDNGTGCKYTGQFKSVKMIGGSCNNLYNRYVFSAVLTDFRQQYASGTYYWASGTYGSSGKYVKSISHPSLQKGKTYYFIYEETVHHGEGGGTGVIMLDSKKQGSGYACLVGSY